MPFPSGAEPTVPENKPTELQPTGADTPIPPDKPPGGVSVVITSPSGSESITIPCRNHQDPEEVAKLVFNAVLEVREEWLKH